VTESVRFLSVGCDPNTVTLARYSCMCVHVAALAQTLSARLNQDLENHGKENICLFSVLGTV